MARERKVQKKSEELDEARLRELVACKAHELYEQRGGSPGRDLDDPTTYWCAEGARRNAAVAFSDSSRWWGDWLEAERLVRQEPGVP